MTRSAEWRYDVAVIRDGKEHIEGQLSRYPGATELKIGGEVYWPAELEPGSRPVSYEVVELREATEHSEAVIVLRRPGV